MARPKKPEIGSPKWAQNEMRVAEARLRLIRRRIGNADEAELPSLLRLEAALRRECERLAKLAAPTVLTESWADARGLEALILNDEAEDE